MAPSNKKLQGGGVYRESEKLTTYNSWHPDFKSAPEQAQTSTLQHTLFLHQVGIISLLDGPDMPI